LGIGLEYGSEISVIYEPKVWQSPVPNQGIRQNQQAYFSTASEQGMSVSKAIESLLIACNHWQTRHKTMIMLGLTGP